MPSPRRNGALPRDGPPRTTESFVEVIQRARAGDQAAWRALVEEYDDEVRLIIGGLFHADDPMHGELDAEDIAQVVWIAVFDALQREQVFLDERAFIGFLRQVTHNCYNKLFRRHVTTTTHCRGRARPFGHGDAKLAADEPGPLELAEASEQGRRFNAGLLPEERVMLRERLDGKTVKEILRDSGVCVRSVQVSLLGIRRRWEGAKN